jgi:hypothetical protein
VRLFLRDFCSEFLENCYNPLMGAVKVRTQEVRVRAERC